MRLCVLAVTSITRFEPVELVLFLSSTAATTVEFHARLFPVVVAGWHARETQQQHYFEWHLQSRRWALRLKACALLTGAWCKITCNTALRYDQGRNGVFLSYVCCCQPPTSPCCSWLRRAPPCEGVSGCVPHLPLACHPCMEQSLHTGCCTLKSAEHQQVVGCSALKKA